MPNKKKGNKRNKWLPVSNTPYPLEYFVADNMKNLGVYKEHCLTSILFYIQKLQAIQHSQSHTATESQEKVLQGAMNALSEADGSWWNDYMLLEDTMNNIIGALHMLAKLEDPEARKGSAAVLESAMAVHNAAVQGGGAGKDEGERVDAAFAVRPFQAHPGFKKVMVSLFSCAFKNVLTSIVASGKNEAISWEILEASMQEISEANIRTFTSYLERSPQLFLADKERLTNLVFQKGSAGNVAILLEKDSLVFPTDLKESGGKSSLEQWFKAVHSSNNAERALGIDVLSMLLKSHQKAFQPFIKHVVSNLKKKHVRECFQNSLSEVFLAIAEFNAELILECEFSVKNYLDALALCLKHGNLPIVENLVKGFKQLVKEQSVTPLLKKNQMRALQNQMCLYGSAEQVAWLCEEAGKWENVHILALAKNLDHGAEIFRFIHQKVRWERKISYLKNDAMQRRSEDQSIVQSDFIFNPLKVAIHEKNMPLFWEIHRAAPNLIMQNDIEFISFVDGYREFNCSLFHLIAIMKDVESLRNLFEDAEFKSLVRRNLVAFKDLFAHKSSGNVCFYNKDDPMSYMAHRVEEEKQSQERESVVDVKGQGSAVVEGPWAKLNNTIEVFLDEVESSFKADRSAEGGAIAAADHSTTQQLSALFQEMRVLRGEFRKKQAELLAHKESDRQELAQLKKEHKVETGKLQARVREPTSKWVEAIKKNESLKSEAVIRAVELQAEKRKVAESKLKLRLANEKSKQQLESKRKEFAEKHAQVHNDTRRMLSEAKKQSDALATSDRAEIASLRLRVSQLEVEQSNLKEAHRAELKEMADAAKGSPEGREIKRLQALIENFERDIGKILKEKEQVLEQNKHLHMELKAPARNIKDVESRIARLMSEKSKLRDENTSLMQQQQKEVEMQQRQWESHKIQMDELKHRLHVSLNAPAMKYGAEIKEVSQELDRAKESLQRSKKENVALHQQCQTLLAAMQKQKLYISGLQAGQTDLRAQRDQAIYDKGQGGQKKDDGLQEKALEAELRRSQEYIECLAQERDALYRAAGNQYLGCPGQQLLPSFMGLLPADFQPLVQYKGSEYLEAARYREFMGHSFLPEGCLLSPVPPVMAACRQVPVPVTVPVSIGGFGNLAPVVADASKMPDSGSSSADSGGGSGASSGRSPESLQRAGR
jgi:hypothetical protein